MTLWTELVALIEALIRATGDVVGGAGMGILLATAVARVALTPITLPAAVRSQLRNRVVRRIRPQLKQIHRDYKDDPAGLSRALKEIHHEHGITVIDGPGIVASLVQLPVLIAFFQAVLYISDGTPLESGGLLPGLAAAAVSVLGVWLSGQGKDSPWMLWLSGTLPLAIALWLGSGIGLYLTGFYGATIIQSVLMRRRLEAASEAP